MKKNTQKLLLALYSEEAAVKNRLSLQNLQLLLPDLSGGGFRSLLFVLKKQGMIATQRVLGTTYVSITHHGTVLLEAEFPALSNKWQHWDGSWECLLFMESPAFDKQFRYLRSLLIQEGALAVNRGVYFAPGGFSQVVVKECQKSYFKSILLFSVSSWKMATEVSFVVEKYGLSDIAETYSGISRDVDRLIKNNTAEKGLIDRDKKYIHLVYDRVLSVLLEDPGFCTFYFKEVEQIKKTLMRLNSLLSV